MAHLAYSQKDRGFYVNTRRELDLGWEFLDGNGNVLRKEGRSDLSPYEKVLLAWRERQKEN